MHHLQKNKNKKSQMTVSNKTSQRGASNISVYFINRSAPKNLKPAKSLTQLTKLFFMVEIKFLGLHTDSSEKRLTLLTLVC